MARLVVSNESGTKSTYELADTIVTVGRAPDNTIQLDDPSVSGRHAKLELSADVYELTDLSSTNGTRVNGDQVTTTFRLKMGDRIRFGKIETRLESESTGDAPLPDFSEAEAKPAETSERPVDFANASPFPNRKKDQDPARLAVLVCAGVALLAFLGSVVALVLIHAPNS